MSSFRPFTVARQDDIFDAALDCAARLLVPKATCTPQGFSTGGGGVSLSGVMRRDAAIM